MSKQAFKFRLSPNKAQEKHLFWTLARCRELYNAGLSERRDSYKYTGRGVTYYEQKRDLPDIKELREEYKDIHSQVLQDVLNRLDYEVIVFEDLAPSNMSKRPKPKQDEETGRYLPNGGSAKSGLNKSILDAGWSTFVMYCQAKAEWAKSVTIIKVDPYKTSQVCSQCGKEGPHKDLSERTHTCLHCGVVLDRDHNAALNVLSAWKRPTGRARLRGKRECPVEAPCL